MTDNPHNPPKTKTPIAAAVSAASLSGFQFPQIQIQGEIQQSTFLGPLPPPEVLAKYEAINPGFANRIVAMAEAEGDHRRNQEKKSLDADITHKSVNMSTREEL